jgi:hypothetical protein
MVPPSTPRCALAAARHSSEGTAKGRVHELDEGVLSVPYLPPKMTITDITVCDHSIRIMCKLCAH